jgi:hypothetical protein
MARCMPRSLDPTWHQAREGEAGPARLGPSPTSSPDSSTPGWEKVSRSAAHSILMAFSFY